MAKGRKATVKPELKDFKKIGGVRSTWHDMSVEEKKDVIRKKASSKGFSIGEGFDFTNAIAYFDKNAPAKSDKPAKDFSEWSLDRLNKGIAKAEKAVTKAEKAAEKAVAKAKAKLDAMKAAVPVAEEKEATKDKDKYSLEQLKKMVKAKEAESK